eukprot:11746780-Karenia_brevis.AAC.1
MKPFNGCTQVQYIVVHSEKHVFHFLDGAFFTSPPRPPGIWGNVVNGDCEHLLKVLKADQLQRSHLSVCEDALAHESDEQILAKDLQWHAACRKKKCDQHQLGHLSMKEGLAMAAANIADTNAVDDDNDDSLDENASCYSLDALVSRRGHIAL